MDALESEINTKPASNFIENFFSKLPIDSRFNKVEFQKFVPITGLSPTSKKIDSWGRFDETAEKSKQQFGEIFTIAQYVLLRKIDLPICFTKS